MVMQARERKRIARVQTALSLGDGRTALLKKQLSSAADLRSNAWDWLDYRCIQGLSIGYKQTTHRNTGEPCLKVLVDHKRPASDLLHPVPDSVPSLDDGHRIPIDVEEVGQLWAHTPTLFPGASVAHRERSAGTLGLVVRSRQNPSELFLLSARHVIAPFDIDNAIKIVRHPAPEDGGTTAANDVGDYFHTYPRFMDDLGFPNLADAALARLRSAIAWQDEIPVIGRPRGIGPVPKAGDLVRIYGRTSRFQVGEVMDPSANVRIRFRRPDGSSFRVGFAAQVECSHYGEPGDSGASVFDSRNRLIGLHVGGSSLRSFFSPIQPILDFFQVEIADPNLDVSHEEDAVDEAPPRYAFPELSAPHNTFGSISWFLTVDGLNADGDIGNSPGELITVPRVWNDFGSAIVDAAKRFEVPVELIIATICTESTGRPNTVREEPGFISDAQTPSKVSAGLMQTLISTAREALQSPGIDRDWLLNPANSIMAGTAYIARQKFQTRYDPPLVACAYNAGSVYENTGVNNRWKTRQFPINSGKHVDRFVLWFNDVFSMFDGLPGGEIPQDSFYFELK